MTILNKYLLRRFSYGILLSAVLLLSIETFFSFTAETDDLNNGNYNFAEMIKYLILTLPGSMKELFPYALLIGALLSLGSMAADLEFVAMQNAGISVKKIINIILIQAFAISVIFYSLCDFFVPQFSKQAEQNKNFAISKRMIHEANGVWFKDGNKFIKVHEVYSNKHLRHINIYEYDLENVLKKFTSIGDAKFIDNKWSLTSIEEISFLESPMSIVKYNNKSVDTLINQNLLDIKTQDSINLSIIDVISNISYLDANNLDNSIQKRIFWEKLLQPFSTIIMLFLAMPFIFGKYRNNNLSKRIVIGVLLGVTFFIISSILSNLGNVIGLLPILNVLAPNILFIYIGYYLYQKYLEEGLR